VTHELILILLSLVLLSFLSCHLRIDTEVWFPIHFIL
jgi:hypothetical protein